MTTLVFCSSLSRTFLDIVIQTIHRERCIVVDTTDDIHAQLKSMGISSLPLRVQGDRSWKERDLLFKEIAMPGNLTSNFPGTELPIWKVLSIDRLSFWNRGAASQNEMEILLALDWQQAVVPLDLRHPIPWVIGRMKPTVAVQTQPIRTREWADLFIANQVPFTEMIAWNQKDAQFISGFLQKHVTHHDCNDWSLGIPATDDERKALRAAMGIPVGVPTALVLFESQTEWEFRTCLPQLMQNYVNVLIYPMTAVDRKNLSGLGFTSGERIKVIDSLSVEPVADIAVVFRYQEDLLKGRRLPIKILDITNRWLSRELAQ